ncbi:MAG TPA: hypothetical protein PKX87_01815 [Alphaproteobacteria bacterium]|nr:hypothetical protein [Alphaproteobacteria bacterium]
MGSLRRLNFSEAVANIRVPSYEGAGSSDKLAGTERMEEYIR